MVSHDIINPNILVSFPCSSCFRVFYRFFDTHTQCSNTCAQILLLNAKTVTHLNFYYVMAASSVYDFEKVGQKYGLPDAKRADTKKTKCKIKTRSDGFAQRLILLKTTLWVGLECLSSFEDCLSSACLFFQFLPLWRFASVSGVVLKVILLYESVAPRSAYEHKKTTTQKSRLFILLPTE